MTESRVFKALGDPLRLRIVQRLSSAPHHTIGTLSEDLGITRQGARRQIQEDDMSQKKSQVVAISGQRISDEAGAMVARCDDRAHDGESAEVVSRGV